MFFRNEAKDRLEVLNPGQGEAAWLMIEGFLRIAQENREVPLVVPPEIDQHLHEVLAARDGKGNTLQRKDFRLSHAVNVELPHSRGRRLRDLDHPLVHRTLQILESAKWQFSQDQVYTQQACVVKVL